MPKILLSEKYCLYIGNDVFEAEVSTREIQGISVSYARIGRGVYLLVPADSLGMRNVDYVALAQVPRRMVAGTVRWDWSTGMNIYRKKLKDLGLSP